MRSFPEHRKVATPRLLVVTYTCVLRSGFACTWWEADTPRPQGPGGGARRDVGRLRTGEGRWVAEPHVCAANVEEKSSTATPCPGLEGRDRLGPVAGT